MEKASFKLESYRFDKASLDFSNSIGTELNLTFKPKGEFYPKEGRYNLFFEVIIDCENTNIITVSCKSSFLFNGSTSIEDIPEYFYPNSIAIIFPYIRAFVSTLSLQANVKPIVLPTINLIGLTNELKENTSIIE